jgi:hypothetical protein
MKSRFISIAVTISLLFIFNGSGICQDKASESDWMNKVSQGNINWSAGYVEAVGIGAPPDNLIKKINARPIALREAKANALRNLLEIIKNVQVDSTATIKDLIAGSEVVDTGIKGLVNGAEIVDYQYMPDGRAEMRLKTPLYGNLARIIMTLATPPPVGSAPDEAAVPAVEFVPASPAQVYTGMIVDARGIQARRAMTLKIFDEEGKAIYGLASVDIEYAIRDGMSGYSKDFITAQSHQRIGANPITVKALRSSGLGKSDIIISNIDAQKVRSLAGGASFLKKCKVMIVLD